MEKNWLKFLAEYVLRAFDIRTKILSETLNVFCKTKVIKLNVFAWHCQK